MDIIYLLIPLALVLLACAIAAFLWAIKNGQFDDLEREAHRILFDEDNPVTTKNTKDKPTSCSQNDRPST